MRRLLRGACGLALAAGFVAGLLVLPRLASANPVTYFFQAGSVTVTATTGPATLLVVPNLPLDGGFVEFDDAVPALTDIQLSLLAAGPYSLSQAYAGYDTVSVANVLLEPAAGYTGPAALQLAGPPVDNYAYNGGPVKVTGTLTASDTTNTAVPNPLVSAFNIVNPNASGTLFVNTVTGNIALLGVTIGVIPASGGEPYPLVLKGDFFFRGLVPEPGTAVMLGVGLIGLVAAGRRVRA